MRDRTVDFIVAGYERSLETGNMFYLGTALHTVQDSYAGGHVARDKNGLIVNFQDYTKQDHFEHGRLDSAELTKIGFYGTGWNQEAAKNPFIQRQMDDSLSATQDILNMFADGVSPDEFRQRVGDKHFRLADGATIGGPMGNETASLDLSSVEE